MFETLTAQENNELFIRLDRAARRYDKLTSYVIGCEGLFRGPMDAWNEINQIKFDLNAAYSPAGMLA